MSHFCGYTKLCLSKNSGDATREASHSHLIQRSLCVVCVCYTPPPVPLLSILSKRALMTLRLVPSLLICAFYHHCCCSSKPEAHRHAHTFKAETHSVQNKHTKTCSFSAMRLHHFEFLYRNILLFTHIITHI